MAVSSYITKIKNSSLYIALCHRKYAIFIIVLIITTFSYLLYHYLTRPAIEENTIRPVRYARVEYKRINQPLSLTGEIAAKNNVALSFRVDGKMTERLLSLGDKVVAGQVVARLDPQDIKDSLTSAQSNLAAARSELTQAARTEARQKALLSKDVTTQARYDDALQQLQSAQAKVESTEAALNQAQNRLEYTDLRADTSGVVTSVEVDAGEVVKAGQAIMRIATDEGIDAVFNVPEKILQSKPQKFHIEVSLSYNPKIKTTGFIREVSPQADSVTRTFVVKVGLIDPPPAMKLGSTVTGSVIVHEGLAVELPVMSLNRSNNGPAVWIIDQTNHTVSLQDVEVEGYTTDSVIISKGLQDGDLVVTAGVQSLYIGQQVKLLEVE